VPGASFRLGGVAESVRESSANQEMITAIDNLPTAKRWFTAAAHPAVGAV
jgi:hypothetical protein